MIKEQKYYADLAGTRTLQQRVLLIPEVTVVALGDGGMETMRTLGPRPRAAGSTRWARAGTGTAELAELPGVGGRAKLPRRASSRAATTW